MSYNFVEDVTVNVGGRVITGLAEDGITYGRQEDNIEMNVGAEGSVLTNIMYNPTGQVTIRLKANSPSITYLNRLANSKTPTSVQVRRTGTINETAGGNIAYVTRPAESQLGRTAENREFVLMVEDYQQR